MTLQLPGGLGVVRQGDSPRTGQAEGHALAGTRAVEDLDSLRSRAVSLTQGFPQLWATLPCLQPEAPLVGDRSAVPVPRLPTRPGNPCPVPVRTAPVQRL